MPRPAASSVRPVALAFVGFGSYIGAWSVTAADAERELGFGHGGYGLLLAVALGGCGLANAVAGGLAERWGTQRLLRRGLVALAAALVALMVVPAPWVLAVAAVLVVSSGGVVDVAMNVAAAVARTDDPGGLIRFHSLFNLGAVIGAAQAGLLLALGVSWRMVWLLPVILAAVIWIWAGSVVLPAGSAGERHGLLHALRTIGRERLVLLAVVFACGAMVEGGIDAWGVLVLRDGLEVSAALGAGAYVVGQAVAAAARAGFGPKAGSMGAPRGLALGGGMAASGLVLLALAPTPIAVCGLALAAIGISVCWPLLIAHASAGRARPGPVVGGVTSIGYVGFVLGPPLVGVLAGAFGLRHAMLLLAAVAVFVTMAPSRMRPAQVAAGPS